MLWQIKDSSCTCTCTCTYTLSSVVAVMELWWLQGKQGAVEIWCGVSRMSIQFVSLFSCVALKRAIKSKQQFIERIRLERIRHTAGPFSSRELGKSNKCCPHRKGV